MVLVKPIYRFFAALPVAMILMAAAFDIAVGNHINWYVTIALYGGEGALLGALLFLLSGRWRRIVPALFWIVALFFWGNAMYFRYWGDLLSWSLIADSASYNIFVVKAIAGLLRGIDLIFLVIPLCLTYLYRRLRISKEQAPAWRTRLIILSLTVAAYCLGLSLSVISSMRYYRYINEPSTFSSVLKHRLSTLSNSRIYEWHGNGLFLYTYIQLARDNGRIEELTGGQLAYINDFLAKREAYVFSDSILSKNQGKNLILIVVESLNSWVVGEKTAGHSLTPTLDSLIRSEGTVACLNVAPQRRHGGSSDGHFMYNTGLLPISYGSAAMLFADNDYSEIALSRFFAESHDFIVENGSVWNHRATTKEYGYDALTEQLDVSSLPIDRTLFDVAADTIVKMRQPFMAEIITLGMHFPFTDSNLSVPRWLQEADIADSQLHDYYKAVYGFDVALSSFIQKIKDAGVYDSSIFVIVSDHDLGVGSRKPDGRIPFIALNTGRTELIERRVGQGDVYPTILSLLGLESQWQGVGLSMLDSRNASTVLPDGSLDGDSGAELDSLKRQAWEVSDLIVRSDYFSGYKQKQ